MKIAFGKTQSTILFLILAYFFYATSHKKKKSLSVRRSVGPSVRRTLRLGLRLATHSTEIEGSANALKLDLTCSLLGFNGGRIQGLVIVC